MFSLREISKKGWLAAAFSMGLFFGASSWLSAAEKNRAEIVVIGDNMSATENEHSWVNRLAEHEAREVVNALRPDWRSAETWYVREILKNHPAAGGYVLIISANDLLALTRFDPEELARVAARAGYMIDLIREKNPAADIVLIAPPAAGNDLVAMSAEILAINLEKTARSRDVKFVSFLDAIAPVKGNVYPQDAAAQNKIAKLVSDELSAPKLSARAPIAAERGIVAPPAAGRALVAGKDARELAAAVAEDFAKMPHHSSRKTTGSPTTEALAQADNGKVKPYVSDRDLASVLSEEGIMLAGGVANEINEALSEELAMQDAARMEMAFNEPGAYAYAQINFQPMLAVGEISAIVPPAGELHTFGEVVNQVSFASSQSASPIIAASKPQPLGLEEIADGVEVPGMLKFENETVLAQAPTIRPKIASAPPQDLSTAPWNRPADVAAAEERARLSANAARARNDYPLPDIELTEVDGAGRHLKVEDFYMHGDLLLTQIETVETKRAAGETGMVKLKNPQLRAFVDGNQEIAMANTRRRPVNDERYLTPSYEPLFGTPGYAVYIHTSIE